MSMKEALTLVFILRGIQEVVAYLMHRVRWWFLGRDWHLPCGK